MVRNSKAECADFNVGSAFHMIMLDPSLFLKKIYLFSLCLFSGQNFSSLQFKYRNLEGGSKFFLYWSELNSSPLRKTALLN